MKKVFAFLLALVMVATLGLPFEARTTVVAEIERRHAEQGEASSDFQIENGVLKEYLGGDGEVVVPDGVTVIGEHAFADKDYITSVTLPEGVTKIENDAFANCTSLSEIALPESLEVIGDYAFSYCISLRSVTIPNGVTDIGGNAFWYCDDLENVAIPDSVVNLGNEIFAGCNKLADEQGLIIVSGYVFGYNGNSETITIPEGVKGISGYAFCGKDVLETVYFPSTLEFIGNSAFIYCSNLKNFEIPESVTKIGNCAFQGCSALADEDGFIIVNDILFDYSGQSETVVVPAGVTEISNDAFFHAKNTKSVILPEGLTRIGEGCFFSLSDLASVSLPGTLKYIDDFAFFYCEGLKEIDLPDGLVSLGYCAFAYSGLTSFDAPEGAEFGDCLLTGCEGLVDENGFIIYRSVLYSCYSDAEKITIPEGVTALASYALEDSENLKTVTLPKTLTSVKNYSFDYSSELEEIIAPCCIPANIFKDCEFYDDKTVTITTAHDWNSSYTADKKATLSENGSKSIHCKDCDAKKKKKVTIDKVSSVNLSKTSYTYDGKAHKPTVTVVDSKGNTLKSGTDYTVTYPSGCKNVGGYTVTVKGKGNYSFTKTLSFDIEKASAIFDKGDIVRTYGNSRYRTSLKTADALKATLGINKFDTIIVAYGRNYADALAGSYLAAVKNAPILVVNTETDKSKTSADDFASMKLVKGYINDNLSKNGTVYILGGTAVISNEYMGTLKAKNRTVKRLSGANRYETNIAILKEAGFKGGDLLVADSFGYADALSASSLGKPILLIDKASGKLTDAQKNYLKSVKSKVKNVYMIGGTAAVPASIQKEVGKIATSAKFTRFAGGNRYETSKLIAEKFFTKPQTIVLAYGNNFPDGLCGGPLAYALGAPLILTHPDTNNASYVKAYVKKNSSIKNVTILGGKGTKENPQLTDSLVKSIKSGKIIENKYK